MKTVRWPSTWSGPDWASSSMTKMQVSFHCGLFETASTTRPSARSLSAIMARGVGYFGLRPLAVVAGQAQDHQVGHRVLAG